MKLASSRVSPDKGPSTMSLTSGENALGKLVDQRVRPEVAGCVRQKTVGPGQDLGLLVGRKRVIALGLPGHVEHARHPGADIRRVDDALPHEQIREAVWAGRTREVVGFPIRQRGDHLRMHIVDNALESQFTVVGDVFASTSRATSTWV